jgi:osmotically-inducible protein OsmY
VAETDDELRRHIRDNLATHLAIAELDLEVDVVEGVVFLRGEVDAEEEIEQATQVAAAVPGVVEVRNQLVRLALRRQEIQPEIIWVRRPEDPSRDGEA